MKKITYGLLCSFLLLSGCHSTSQRNDIPLPMTPANEAGCLEIGGEVIQGHYGTGERDIQCPRGKQYLDTFEVLVGGDVMIEKVCCK